MCSIGSSCFKEPNKQELFLSDYRCGSPANWSQLFTLRTLGDETSSPTFAFYGDFGLENARSLPWLIDDVNRERFDAVLHAGDLAYNLFNVSCDEAATLEF